MESRYILYKDIENKIINHLTSQYPPTNSEKLTYSVNDFYFILSTCLNTIDFEKIEKNTMMQIIKNALSSMYKNNQIFRLKRNKYSFSNEIYKLKIDIDQNKYDDCIIHSLYFDYLNKKTNAIPVDDEIFYDERLFKNIDKEIKCLFLSYFKQFKCINKNIEFNSDAEKNIYKSLIFLSKNKHLNNKDIELYIIEILNNYQLTKEQFFSFINKNKKYLKHDGILINSFSKLERILYGK